MKNANHLKKDWLYERYIVDNLSSLKIAKLVGRTHTTILTTLKRFDIPIRTKKEANKNNGGWNRGKHLSLKHRENVSKSKIGENNGNWKGGISDDGRSKCHTFWWKQILKQVYQRDSFKCQRCDSVWRKEYPLHAHHVKNWRDYPDNRFDFNNLITLCSKCHRWVHSKKNVNNDFIEVAE
jgi:hypothetical protein